MLNLLDERDLWHMVYIGCVCSSFHWNCMCLVLNSVLDRFCRPFGESLRWGMTSYYVEIFGSFAWWFFWCCPKLVPRVFHLPTPKQAREERPWFRLVTCLGEKFIFKGGVPVYQSIVAAGVCYLLNRLSGQPWKALFRFRSEDMSYQVHCFQHLKLNWVWKLWKDKKVKV